MLDFPKSISQNMLSFQKCKRLNSILYRVVVLARVSCCIVAPPLKVDKKWRCQRFVKSASEGQFTIFLEPFGFNLQIVLTS